jgi:hypothetical protein
MIVLTIYMRVAQINPVVGMQGRGKAPEQHQGRKKHHSFSH